MENKEGLIFTFKEEPGSIAAALVAYIKETQGSSGDETTQKGLIDRIIQIAGIDLKQWKVKEFKLYPNAWGVTMKQKEWRGKKRTTKTWAEQAMNYQLKVEIKFERIQYDIETAMLDSFKEIVKDMPAIEIPEIITKKIRNGVAAELATYDAHFGKLAWLQETTYRHYDVNIAAKDYTRSIDNNLDLISPHKPEQIFYIIGQDMYHIDNLAGHTTSGSHTLDVDGRITKVHIKTFTVSRDSIIKARKIGPVKVVWIPGNHDFLASYMLVFALMQYFRNWKGITFDLSEASRKAVLWGNLLVGWTHRIVGRYNTWSNELAQAFPELWGKSKFREWHHGDQHKKHNVKIVPLFTSGGVVCRQITALSPVDKWHFENLFTDAVPGGESFLWSKDVGVFANFMVWTGQYENK